MRILALILLLLSSLIAFGQTERKIAPGDRLKLTCPEEPQLSRIYTVTTDGLLLINFLGAVPVAGKTLKEAGTDIADRLIKGRYVRKATISFAFQSEPSGKFVKVSGEAKNKEPIAWVEGMRLADVIRIAEPTTKADLHKITVVTVGSTSAIDFTKFNPATNVSNPLLKPDDEVKFVSKDGSGGGTDTTGGGTGTTTGGGGGTTTGGNTSGGNTGGGTTNPPPSGGTLYVMGGVARPGMINYVSGMTVRGAINAAGGFTARGDTSRIKIDRGQSDPLMIDLSISSNDTPVLPGDQIIVDIVNAKKFLQVIGTVRNPGLVEFFDGITMSQALMAAGGLDKGAKAGEIKVTTNGGTKKINYEDVMKGYRGEPILKAGDIIEVPGPKGSTLPSPTPALGNNKKKERDILTVIGAAAILFFIIGR